MQPTQCINQLSSWYGTTFRKKNQKTLQRQRPDSDETQTSCVAGCELYLLPLSSVFVHQRAKNCPSMTKVKRGQDTHYLSVYQIWGLYIICKAMNADKWLWPIFGCKVGQSVQIGMKLEPDVWHHPLDVYATFKTDISQHVQKSPEDFSLAGSSSNTPFQVFLSTRGPKIAQSWRKSVRIKTLRM